jgi:hypothetical protein
MSAICAKTTPGCGTSSSPSSCSSSPSEDSTPGAAYPPAAGPAGPGGVVLVAGDTAVLVLGAAARLVNHCARVASTSDAANDILSRGFRGTTSGGPGEVHPQGGGGMHTPQEQQCPDDLVTALDAVLSLAYHNVTCLTWWDRATDTSPLALIQALHETSTVSGC